MFTITGIIGFQTPHQRLPSKPSRRISSNYSMISLILYLMPCIIITNVKNTKPNLLIIVSMRYIKSPFAEFVFGNSFYSYSFDFLSNINQVLDKDFLKNHGCLFPLETNKPNGTMCTFLNQSHDSTWDGVIYRKFKEFCHLPCVTMQVRFAGLDGTTDNGNENETFVKFYIKDQIQVRESHLSYTEVSLLAELGGYVGLIIGVSLMDIASFIDKMFAIVIQRLNK